MSDEDRTLSELADEAMRAAVDARHAKTGLPRARIIGMIEAEERISHRHRMAALQKLFDELPLRYGPSNEGTPE